MLICYCPGGLVEGKLCPAEHSVLISRWCEQRQTSPLLSIPWEPHQPHRTFPSIRCPDDTSQTTELRPVLRPSLSNQSFTPRNREREMLTKSEVMLMMKQMKPKIQQLQLQPQPPTIFSNRLLKKSSPSGRQQRDWNGSFSAGKTELLINLHWLIVNQRSEMW